jgi:hypothetical protein
MFKPGDRVVCININNNYINNVVIGKTYTVVGFFKASGYVIVKDDEEIYDFDCFISLQEYRKQKLEKLCLSQEIE